MLMWAGSALVGVLGGQEEGLLGEYGAPFCHSGAHHLLASSQVSTLRTSLAS